MYPADRKQWQTPSDPTTATTTFPKSQVDSLDQRRAITVNVLHLNCGTMRPIGGPYVCHVLLIETDNGLVLVDTGFGLHDVNTPTRVGVMRHVIRPVFDPDETAVRQVERLGYRRDDVRHIIATHLDLDHIGGAADFPRAHIHVTATEAAAAAAPAPGRERVRYRKSQLEHGAQIVAHEPGSDEWRGFAGAKELTDIAPGIVMVPLPGHTRGHACLAVDAGHRWVLHAGDAFFHHSTIDSAHRTPWSIKLTEASLAMDRKQLRDNHTRLAELRERSDSDLLIVSAHSHELLKQAQSTA